MWFFSRILIIFAMQVIAPSLDLSSARDNFIPTTSWEIFSHWDGEWYNKIVAEGYEYAKDGQQHSIAFFPLFPLITYAVCLLFGYPSTVAGPLVNNLAFLGALIILYDWVESSHGKSAASWTIAILAWCPYSLFGTVNYTEGLFLLCSTAALRSFDKHHYGSAALWGAMTTATRPPGIVLVAAFLLVAWREKRAIIAYVTCTLATGGLFSFIIFNSTRFGDPLAFKNAQQGWAGNSWLSEFQNIFKEGIFAGDSLLKVVIFFGSAYLLWFLRKELSNVALAYGFCTLGLLLTVNIQSFNRFAFGTVSLSLALGILLSRCQPFVRLLVMSLFILLLIFFSIRWAYYYWVA